MAGRTVDGDIRIESADQRGEQHWSLKPVLAVVSGEVGLDMNPSTATMWCRLRLYFVPFLITATRRHATVYARYQQLYALMDSAAAIAFIVGSVSFLDPGKKTAGEWLFSWVGSFRRRTDDHHRARCAPRKAQHRQMTQRPRVHVLLTCTLGRDQDGT